MTNKKITVTVSLEARMNELVASEEFHRERCQILAQWLIESQDALRALDVQSNARIAGLEEELRQARQHSILIEEVTHAE